MLRSSMADTREHAGYNRRDGAERREPNLGIDGERYGRLGPLRPPRAAPGFVETNRNNA